MSKSLREYLTIGDAAELVGVSIDTLRNWDRAGKLKAARHPINGYRLYRREQLELLLDAAEDATAGENPASRPAIEHAHHA